MNERDAAHVSAGPHASRRPSILALLIAAALLLLFFALWGAPPLAQAAVEGKLIGLVQDGTVEWIAEINPTTGVAITVGEGLANCCFAVGLNSALDPENGRLFAVMRQLDEATPRLFTFDIASGAGQASAPLTTTSGVNYLTYDVAGSQLLALTYDPLSDRTQLVGIDPSTGAFTPIGSGLDSCCTPSSLEAAFDSANRHLFAAMSPTGASTTTLYTFDVTSGLVISTVALPASIYAVNHIIYDETASTLWALVFGKQEAEAERLAVIDIATGDITPRGAGVPDCCGLLAADIALDAGSQTLIAPLSTFGGDPFLATYDLATGAVLDQPPLTGPTLHYVKHYVPPLPQEPMLRLYLPTVLRAQ